MMRHQRPIRRHCLHLVPPIALVVLLAAGAGLLATPAASAAGKPGPQPAAAARITFGAQPATQGALDKRPNYRYAVTPGGTLRDQVGVRNVSAEPITLQVYATDAVNVNNGGFGLLPRAQRPHDVGEWVAVGGGGSVTVKPRSFVVLPLSLKVPPNAQPGDHTGGIVVSVTTRTRNATGTNTVLEQRVGVRMFVRVSGPLRPSLTVHRVSADYFGAFNPFGRGRTKVTYDVTNTGNVNLGGRQRVSVQGLLGGDQYSLSIPNAELLMPGGTFSVTTSVPRTWPLVHERVTASIDPLVQQGDLVAGLKAGSGSAVFWAMPWSLLTVLLALVLGLLVWRRIRSSRRARVAPSSLSESTPATPTVPDDLPVRRVAVGVSSAVAVLLLAPAAVVLLAAAPAYAESVPFTDRNATGGITLCDAQGSISTSGRVDLPLGATVVGGTAAVAPYDKNTPSATLVAYQPRRSVEPGEWSGQGMTGLSRYSNPKHPMVEILPQDYTIRGFVDAYPAQWDGLVQLRIYLRALNQPTKNDTYAATTLKVTGGTWRQLGPQAGAPCNVGRTEAVARLMGLVTVAPTGRAGAAQGKSAGSAPTSVSGKPLTASSASRSSGAPQALASGDSSSLTSSASGNGTNPLIWAGSLAALLAVAFLLLRSWRPRWGRRAPE
jgi:hypothetical protein